MIMQNFMRALGGPSEPSHTPVATTQYGPNAFCHAPGGNTCSSSSGPTSSCPKVEALEGLAGRAMRDQLPSRSLRWGAREGAGRVVQHVEACGWIPY